LGRVAREYLTAICPSNRVWSIPGRLTALLRSRWGLNTLISDTNHKNRSDQRHHAIDAAVVTVTDRRLLARISHLAARGLEEGVHRFLEGLEEPWTGFRTGLAFGLGKIVVSYKPDHGTGARLHNDTAYGLVDPSQSLDGPVEVVHRIPLLNLKSADQLEQIRDDAVRNQIEQVTRGKTGKEFTAALEAFSEKTQIRRIRIKQPLSVIAIRRTDGTPYKAYKGDGNYCYQVFSRQNDGDWIARITSTFDAANGRFPATSDYLVMQLCMNDSIRMKHIESDAHTIYRVVKFSQGRVFLAPHNEGGNLKERDADRSDHFKYLNCSSSRLQRVDAQQVVVDTLGQVWPMAYPHAGENR
jgi:CRISPR-associated endonuclease Csn1